MNRLGIAIACLLLALQVAEPGPALAYEDQLNLEAGLGYTAMPSEPEPQHFIGLSTALGVGLGDAWTLRTAGSFGYGLQPEHPTTDLFARITVEGYYLIDIVQLVPYAGFGLGATLLAGSEVTVAPTVMASVGADYLLNRTMLIGAAYRFDLLIDAGPLAGHQQQHTVELKVGWRFDR